MKKLFFSALLIGANIIAFGQKNAKGLEAKLVFEIVYEELPELFEPYRAMLPKEMISYVKGSKIRVEQSTMGVTTVNVSDSDKKTGFMLMDQFGEKTAYTMEPADFEKESKNGSEDYEVTYTKETKEILGYNCVKVDLTNKLDGSTAYAWVTEEIKATTKNYSFLKGFALEYSVHTDNEMTIVMKVKSLEKMKVANTYFEIPKDYTKKSMSDLQKQMEEMQKAGEKD